MPKISLAKITRQNRSPRILLASRISLLISVIRRACAVHRLASSNKETTAASVASCSAWSAALWKRNSVSKLRSLTIWRTEVSAKCTLAVEGCLLHEKVGRTLVLLDLSEGGSSRF